MDPFHVGRRKIKLNWSGKRVFVTGASGFIGSHLCEVLLELGTDVTAMIHYNSRGDWGNLEYFSPKHKAALRVVAGNIEDSDFINRQIRGQQIIFHLASLIGIPYSYMAPLSYVRTNVEGTLNVMEAARQAEVERVIHTSTSETYGTAIYTPINEAHPLQAQSPYSASKIGADKVVESYYRAFNLPVTTIRPFNTFGPRQSARAVIPTIISQALTQSEIHLGSLDPVRDITYVLDTVQGFIKGAEANASKGETINIGTGTGLTIGEIASKVLSLMDIKKSVIIEEQRVRPENSEVFELICDNTAAKQKLGWFPKYSLEDGLQTTIEFIKGHIHEFKPSQYNV